jgi:choline dehydrogenase
MVITADYRRNPQRELTSSAGVIGSPQILQLSGIGPKDKLDPLGVTNRVDLPVGYNLQDHISASMYFNTP